jgi:coenzyme F420-reducing hydrogenase delta subunit
MMCTGRFDPCFPLEGLANGADAVFIGGCHPGECHYIDGNYHALISAALVHETLERLGIHKERFLIDWASAAEGPNFVKIITRFTEQVGELGPLGQAEDREQEELQQQLRNAADVARNRKVRTNLISASKAMMKSGDFSRPAIADLVASKCDKNLTALIGGKTV